MDIESYRDFCLSLPYVTEGFPFDTNTLVFKVKHKMFALTDVNNFESINLKCDPEQAVLLREKYDAVLPGYHMSKMHWNTILMDGSISDAMIKQWIKDSFQLVVNTLPKKDRFILED
jgi:predicted DNA-binding protein (MmcQ/YjbR family)